MYKLRNNFGFEAEYESKNDARQKLDGIVRTHLTNRRDTRKTNDGYIFVKDGHTIEYYIESQFANLSANSVYK